MGGTAFHCEDCEGLCVCVVCVRVQALVRVCLGHGCVPEDLGVGMYVPEWWSVHVKLLRLCVCWV